MWNLSSGEGIGQFGTGQQPLTLLHLDGSLIVVRREDTTGPARGLIALYIGTINGNQIDGSVTYWHGGGPRTDTWVGRLESR